MNMDVPLYPTSLAELDAWRRRHHATLDEARKRFVQFAVLESIAAVPALRDALAFKGGNALRFAYGNSRSTLDLDFSADGPFPDDATTIRTMLDGAFAVTGRAFGIKVRCQRVERQPPGADKTRVTYLIRAGYQLPGDRYFADFETGTRAVSTVVDLEISLNDVVCSTRSFRLSPHRLAEIKVCVLEDIVAEKLRALLQQRTRNRNRRQDAYDIARVLRQHGNTLDLPRVADYLVRKARARDVDVSRGAFDDEIRRRAAFDYEGLQATTGAGFIPFDEAWQAVLGLVRELNIPD